MNTDVCIVVIIIGVPDVLMGVGGGGNTGEHHTVLNAKVNLKMYALYHDNVRN